MQSNTRFTVGAAMPAEMLPDFQDWLLARQRDLELQDTIVPEVLDGDWQSIASTVRDLLDGHTGRLGVHGPFLGLTLMARDPKIRAVTLGRFRQALEFVEAINGTHMVLHSPFPFFGDPFAPHSSGHGLTEQIELIHETLDPIVPTAEAIGCTLVIETIFDLNPSPLLSLIRSFESNYVRLSVDTGHTFITSQRGGPTPDQWIRDAGDMLGHLHLQDSDGRFDRHWPPGIGNINWHAIFEALSELTHRPRLIIELGDKKKAPAAAKWLSEQGLAG